MNQRLRKIAEQFIPYAALGMSIVLVIVVAILLINFLFWGLLIGAACYAIARIKQHFFVPKKPDASKGRLIDHDDIK